MTEINRGGDGIPGEIESTPLDITHQFLSLDGFSFQKFLWDDLGVEKAPHLLVRVEWDDKMTLDTAFQLKAFSDSRTPKQIREAVIVCTKEVKNDGVLGQAGNVFASGVKWEEKK